MDPLEALPAARRPPAAPDLLTVDLAGLTGQLDSAESAADVLDLLVLDAFASGRQPFSRGRELEDVRSGAPLVPPGARVVREARDDARLARLAAGEGWTLRSVRWLRSRRASVVVTATSDELAAEQLERAVAGAVDAERPRADRVWIDFWHQTRDGPRRVPRRIEAASWASVRGNYSAAVAGAVAPLVALTPGAVDGRLLLLHGPPGTGKTSLLRSLAREWRRWCRVDCVLDPERLFEDSAYLLDVALGDDEEDDEDAPSQDGAAGDAVGRWRMLLLEDCDELIRVEAKASTGQQLSRLLNLTDGLLGQGRRVMVAITTNEDVARLHPAVVRPGRCLAQVEVGRLGPAEARAWLDRAGAGGGGEDGRDRPVPVGPDGATLAELCALRSGAATGQPAAVTPGTGLYL